MTNDANSVDLIVETCIYVLNNYKKEVCQVDCIRFLEIKLHYFANNIHLQKIFN